jgi:hypothetical protein
MSKSSNGMNRKRSGEIARLSENIRNQFHEFLAKIPKPVINRSKTHKSPTINRHKTRPFSPVPAYYRLLPPNREFCPRRAPVIHPARLLGSFVDMARAIRTPADNAFAFNLSSFGFPTQPM